MSIEQAVIATTNIDRHGERLALTALESMVEQSRTAIIPVYIEHDPRNPPVGRTIKAEVRKRHDSEYELLSTYELFDNQTNLAQDSPFIDKSDRREIRLRSYPDNGIQIIWDRSFRDPSDQLLLQELVGTGSTRMHLAETYKKAIEPISILIIGAGVYVLGKIADGFLSNIGSDGWKGFKGKLSQIFTKKKGDTGEAVLHLDFHISTEKTNYSVSVLATNPDESDIDALFDLHIHQLDSLVAKILTATPDVRVIVFEYRKGSMSAKYMIRRDGIPMAPQTSGLD